MYFSLQKKIVELLDNLKELELARNTTLQAKETATMIEKSALDKYKEINDEKKRQEQSKDYNEALETFTKLDSNKNEMYVFKFNSTNR